MATLSVTVRGKGQLTRLIRNVEFAQTTDVERQLHRAMRQSARPLEVGVKADIPLRIPRRGGYAATIRSTILLSHKTRGFTMGAGLDITCRAKGRKRFRDVRALEHGRLRHPVFGNRSIWVLQHIVARFFSGPIVRRRGEIADEITDATDRVANSIALV